MCVFFCLVLCVYVLFNIEDAVSTLIPVNALPLPTKWCHPHISSVPPTAFTIRPLMEGQSLFLGGPICTNFIRRHWQWNWSYHTNVLPWIPRDTAIHEAWVNPHCCSSVQTKKLKMPDSCTHLYTNQQGKERPMPISGSRRANKENTLCSGPGQGKGVVFPEGQMNSTLRSRPHEVMMPEVPPLQRQKSKIKSLGPRTHMRPYHTRVNNQINKIYCQAHLERVLVPFWQKVLTFLLDLGGN